jgi:Rieske Fe-S protein
VGRRLVPRLALAIAVVLAAGALIAFAVNSRSQHDKSAVVTVDVRGLAAGRVLTTRYTIAAGGLHHAPVFVARENNGHLVAFLGRSTHLGCKVALANDPRWPRFKQPPNVAFEDPCGGSVWALDGDCVSGPCPRGLSTFPLKVTGATAEINLSLTVPGKPRVAA